MPRLTTSTLERRLLQKLPGDVQLGQCWLKKSWRRCGKKGCHCAAEGEDAVRHGPYWYLYTSAFSTAIYLGRVQEGDEDELARLGVSLATGGLVCARCLPPGVSADAQQGGLCDACREPALLRFALATLPSPPTKTSGRQWRKARARK